MSSLTDILTAAKNLVQAVNSVGQFIARGQGNLTSTTITGTTLICTGNGYLVSASVTVAGSTPGHIYNSSTTGAAAAANMLMTINPSEGTGVVLAGIPFSLGLIATPGTGQSLNVTYYQQ